jgi:hypothetical protein
MGTVFWDLTDLPYAMDSYTDYRSPVAEIWNRAGGIDPSLAPFSALAWHAEYTRLNPTEGKPLILADPDGPVIGSFLVRDTTAVFGGGGEIADYLDVIGPPESKPQFWQQAMSVFRSRGITRLSLRNIPDGSPTLRYYRAFTAGTAAVSREDTTPVMNLPDSWDGYREGLTKKYRHELERKLRKFERERPDADVSELPATAGMDVLLPLMRKNADKQRFLTPDMTEFFRNIPDIAGPALRIHVLTAGGHPVSAVAGFVSGRQYLLYNSGFDEASAPGGGFYLKARLIQRTIGEGFSRFNFLQGNERYKYELGGADFPVYSITAMLS